MIEPMPTNELIGDGLANRILKFRDFKIGKTGQKLQERYFQEDKDDFTEMVEIFSTGKREWIDMLEAYLINRFINDTKCMNKQIGGGEMEKSNTLAKSIKL